MLPTRKRIAPHQGHTKAMPAEAILAVENRNLRMLPLGTHVATRPAHKGKGSRGHLGGKQKS